jgi:hypothetical protein
MMKAPQILNDVISICYTSTPITISLYKVSNSDIQESIGITMYLYIRMTTEI